MIFGLAIGLYPRLNSGVKVETIEGFICPSCALVGKPPQYAHGFNLNRAYF